MNNTDALVALLATLTVTASFFTKVGGVRPMFVESLKNLTVPIGRDATFTCVVRHLGGYRVGWVKADSKAIQAIHTHVITHNPRVRVSHRDQTTWNLHINQVQEEDRGTYMCQINYDPMMSQYGVLNVVVPPDIVSDESSGDLTIPEGGSGELRCKARGYPAPTITWRREDGRPITVTAGRQGTDGWQRSDATDHWQHSREPEFEGEILPLNKVKRSDTGYYLCIASNGLPPSVSKKIKVEVHFHPVVQVPTQLLGVQLGSDVTLRCHVEALPKSINYWNKKPGAILIENGKFNITEDRDSEYSLWMILTIRSFEPSDAGDYVCTAKNSIGEVQSTIEVYEIRPRDPDTPPVELDRDVTYVTSEEEEHQQADRSPRLDLVPQHADLDDSEVSRQPAGEQQPPGWRPDQPPPSAGCRLLVAGPPLLLLLAAAVQRGL